MPNQPNQPHTVSESSFVRHTDSLWDIDQLARYLRCTPRTIKRRMKSDGLPFKRVGRRVLFRPAEIDQWIEAQQEPQQDRAA